MGTFGANETMHLPCPSPLIYSPNKGSNQVKINEFPSQCNTSRFFQFILFFLVNLIYKRINIQNIQNIQIDMKYAIFNNFWNIFV